MDQYEMAHRRAPIPYVSSPRPPQNRRSASAGSSQGRRRDPRSARSYRAGDYNPQRVSWTTAGVSLRSAWTTPSGRPVGTGRDPAFDLPVIYGRFTAPEYANGRGVLLRKSMCVRQSSSVQLVTMRSHS
eukprot:SAG31_NODE_3878_length_3791_cov_2.674702_3_plen_129_part_00